MATRSGLRDRMVSVVLAIVAFLVSIEPAFRVIAPQPIRPAVYADDPVFGLRMIADLEGYASEREFSHGFRLNRLGFRDPERGRAKPADTFRILGLGDSFAWGAGVEEPEGFLRQLETRLNARREGRRYEVLNWGVPAWGTAQKLLALEREGLAYRPDLVIVEYYKSHDVAQNVYFGLFRFDDAGRLIPSRASPATASLMRRVTDYVPGYRLLSQHSHAFSFLRLRLLRAAERRDAAGGPAGSSGRPDDGLRLTAAILERLVFVARSQDIPVALLVVPDKGELLGDAPVRGRLPEHLQAEDEMLRTVSDKRRIPVLFLAPLLARASADGTAPYYRFDPHFNRVGYRLVADALLDFLEHHKLLPGGDDRR